MPAETSPARDRSPSGPPPVGGEGPAGSQLSYGQRILSYHRLWIGAVLVLALDQVTKGMITARLPFGAHGPDGRIEVIPGLLNLIHVGNTGAAWSMFSGKSTGLALLAVGTLAAIFYFRRALGLNQRGLQPGFGLLCGGIVGNLVDRIRLGHVVDFLDFHFGSYVYPTFNVADSAIFLGVCWYVLWSIRHPVENAKGQGPNAK